MPGMHPHEKLLRDWLSAGDRGDVDAFDRYLHPDVIVNAPLGLSTQGVEAEKAVWADAKAAMPDIRHEVQETMALESRAVARVVVTGTLIGDFAGISAAGKSFMIDQVIFAHIRDALIVEAWEIADTGSLLSQLGAQTWFREDVDDHGRDDDGYGTECRDGSSGRAQWSGVGAGVSPDAPAWGGVTSASRRVTVPIVGSDDVLVRACAMDKARRTTHCTRNAPDMSPLARRSARGTEVFLGAAGSSRSTSGAGSGRR